MRFKSADGNLYCVGRGKLVVAICLLPQYLFSVLYFILHAASPICAHISTNFTYYVADCLPEMKKTIPYTIKLIIVQILSMLHVNVLPAQGQKEVASTLLLCAML